MTASTEPTEILSTDQVGMQFGGLTALKQISFSVRPKEILAVIGPNGAGKTTLFNIVTGVYEATHGKVMILKKNPAAPFDASTAIYLLSSTTLTAVGLFCSVNIEELWAGLITNNYIYQQPFPWDSLGSSFFAVWEALSWWHSIGVLLIGAVVGLCAGWNLWSEARCSPEIVMRRGIARTFQNIRIFPRMTVLANILVGMHSSLKASVIGDSFALPWSRREDKLAHTRAHEILRLVHLEQYSAMPADKLSYGHQRRLEIARALASSPKLILLDEPAAGMNPSEADELIEIITAIRQLGIAVLLIEHHMDVVMGISDRIVVLDYGKKIAEGTPEEIRANPVVIAAYLGTAEADE